MGTPRICSLQRNKPGVRPSKGATTLYRKGLFREALDNLG